MRPAALVSQAILPLPACCMNSAQFGEERRGIFGLIFHGCFNLNASKPLRSQTSNVFVPSEKLKRKYTKEGAATQEMLREKPQSQS